jgi:dynein light intermediate chain 2
MPSATAKKAAPPQDDDSNSILARLTNELKQGEQQEDTSLDVTILFCGAKRSGKTSLIDRYINPQKDEKDVPKPTVALDYKYARHTVEGSASKVLAHIYDLSGTDVTAEVLSIPVSATSAGNLVLAVVVDLSEPHNVLPSLDRWLQQLRAQASKSLDALAKESALGAKRVEAVRAARLAAFEGHADLAQMQQFPVPLVILGTKWDVLAGNDVTPDQRKSLCRALRFFAHANGAHLVFTSLKDKAAMANVRNLLRWLLFGVPPSKGMAEQLDPHKPLCVVAGKDSMANIGGPSRGKASASGWAEAISAEFPDLKKAEGGKKAEGDQVAEDLLKFPESAVDGTVEQRQEELQAYRKQAERNQRLASEGIDGARGILAN